MWDDTEEYERSALIQFRGTACHSLSTQCSIMDISQGLVSQSNLSVVVTRLLSAILFLMTSYRWTVVCIYGRWTSWCYLTGPRKRWVNGRVKRKSKSREEGFLHILELVWCFIAEGPGTRHMQLQWGEPSSQSQESHTLGPLCLSDVDEEIKILLRGKLRCFMSIFCHVVFVLKSKWLYLSWMCFSWSRDAGTNLWMPFYF